MLSFDRSFFVVNRIMEYRVVYIILGSYNLFYLLKKKKGNVFFYFLQYVIDFIFKMILFGII